jgi:N-acetylneuraminic acid mutarotase
VRKSIALLLALVFLTASCIVAFKPVQASSADSWTSKASLHEARALLGVAVVNGKIYAIGGSTESGFSPNIGGFVGTNEEYDPATDTWTFKASMPTPRARFAIAVYRNKIYCIGGKANAIIGVNEVYDPATDTWENKTPMPTPRDTLQANVVGGKIYLVGGYPSSTLNEVYDPENDSWTTKASMPTGASSYASAVVDNRIYVIGGYSNPPIFWSNLNQIYNPETDKWSLGTPAPSSVYIGAAGATTGVTAPKLIYVIAVPGYNGLVATPCLNQVYDPENDSWTVGADVPTNRLNFGVAVVNDTLYAIGGHTYADWGFISPSEANEQYVPIGYGTVPPAVAVVSPENITYAADNVSLVFTVNKPVVWMGYSLDGQETVTVTGNTTIAGLTNGLHNVTVYAKDPFKNTGTSETISFSVEVPFPTTLVVTASGVAVVIVGAGLLVYFKKRKH